MFKEPYNSADYLKRGAITAAVAVVAAVLLAWAASSGIMKNSLASLKLIPSPERYTELYFNNTLDLPNQTTGKPLAFSFTIHNVEGQPTVYPYSVLLVGPTGVSETISKGTVSTGAGQTVAVPVDANLPKGLINAQIVVELPNQDQSIDWWIGKSQ